MCTICIRIILPNIILVYGQTKRRYYDIIILLYNIIYIYRYIIDSEKWRLLLFYTRIIDAFIRSTFKTHVLERWIIKVLKLGLFIILQYIIRIILKCYNSLLYSVRRIVLFSPGVLRCYKLFSLRNFL